MEWISQTEWNTMNENKFIRPVHPICPSHTAHPPPKFTLYSPSERIRTPRYPPCLLLFIFGEKWPQWVASTWVARGRWTGWTANPLMISPGRTHPTGFARTTFAAPPALPQLTSKGLNDSKRVEWRHNYPNMTRIHEFHVAVLGLPGGDSLLFCCLFRSQLPWSPSSLPRWSY